MEKSPIMIYSNESCGAKNEKRAKKPMKRNNINGFVTHKANAEI